MDSFLAVTEGICQLGREYHTDQNGCENAALFDAVCHREGLRLVSIIENFHHHAIMELPSDFGEFWGAAKLLHDLPQASSADRIKCFGQINKGHVEVPMLLLTFFLELTRSKNHVRRRPRSAWKPHWVSGSKPSSVVLEKAVEEDESHNFPSNGQEGDASVIVTRLTVAFPLVGLNSHLSTVV